MLIELIDHPEQIGVDLQRVIPSLKGWPEDAIVLIHTNRDVEICNLLKLENDSPLVIFIPFNEDGEINYAERAKWLTETNDLLTVPLAYLNDSTTIGQIIRATTLRVFTVQKFTGNSAILVQMNVFPRMPKKGAISFKALEPVLRLHECRLFGSNEVIKSTYYQTVGGVARIAFESGGVSLYSVSEVCLHWDWNTLPKMEIEQEYERLLPALKKAFTYGEMNVVANLLTKFSNKYYYSNEPVLKLFQAAISFFTYFVDNGSPKDLSSELLDCLYDSADPVLYLVLKEIVQYMEELGVVFIFSDGSLQTEVGNYMQGIDAKAVMILRNVGIGKLLKYQRILPVFGLPVPPLFDWHIPVVYSPEHYKPSLLMPISSTALIVHKPVNLASAIQDLTQPPQFNQYNPYYIRSVSISGGLHQARLAKCSDSSVICIHVAVNHKVLEAHDSRGALKNALAWLGNSVDVHMEESVQALQIYTFNGTVVSISGSKRSLGLLNFLEESNTLAVNNSDFLEPPFVDLRGKISEKPSDITDAIKKHVEILEKIYRKTPDTKFQYFIDPEQAKSEKLIITKLQPSLRCIDANRVGVMGSTQHFSSTLEGLREFAARENKQVVCPEAWRNKTDDIGGIYYIPFNVDRYVPAWEGHEVSIGSESLDEIGGLYQYYKHLFDNNTKMELLNRLVVRADSVETLTAATQFNNNSFDIMEVITCASPTIERFLEWQWLFRLFETLDMSLSVEIPYVHLLGMAMKGPGAYIKYVEPLDHRSPYPIDVIDISGSGKPIALLAESDEVVQSYERHYGPLVSLGANIRVFHRREVQEAFEWVKNLSLKAVPLEVIRETYTWERAWQNLRQKSKA